MTPQMLPRPLAAAPRAYNFPRFSRQTLSNGLRVIVCPVHKLPLVTVLAVVDAGAVYEAAGAEGVAALTARLLPEGTSTLDGATLADRFERVGARVETNADWDVAGVSLTTLREQLDEALPLVRDLLVDPVFPEREVERLKAERIAELMQQEAEPRGLADEEFAAAVYVEGARYSRPDGGTRESVECITRDDVVAFHAARYRPAATTLIFVGDVTEAVARELSESLFALWAGAAVADSRGNPNTVQEGSLVRIVAKADAAQSEVRVGHAGVSRTAPDYFDAMVMNAILGGLFSSRINLNLREAHGYTYGAYSTFEWRRAPGPFVVSTAVKSEVTADAVREIVGEIVRMRETAVSESELTLATDYLDGVFPIRYETTAAIASALAMLVVHGLPDSFYDEYRANVRAVTAAHVLRAARTHLHPDRLRIVVVGDANAIGDLDAAIASDGGVRPITDEGSTP